MCFPNISSAIPIMCNKSMAHYCLKNALQVLGGDQVKNTDIITQINPTSAFRRRWNYCNLSVYIIQISHPRGVLERQYC